MLDGIELRRLALQVELDAVKTAIERNQMGQFATPALLADDVLAYARRFLQDTPVRFLDPAIGTGSFYSALRRMFPAGQIEHAEGYEIDTHYALPTMELWRETPLVLRVADFTDSKPPISDEDKANLLICNPPYVRHHHMTGPEKLRLQALVESTTGVRLSGLAGLYCYFMCLSHTWLAQGGLAGWLIPSEFMDVNYGQAVKRYLLDCVTLHRVHRFDPNDAQFGDAIVSSAVVWFSNTPPAANHSVEFSFGGTVRDPAITRQVSTAILHSAPKWTRFPSTDDHAPSSQCVTIGDLFDIKRGLATGSNEFFMLTAAQVQELGLPMEFLRPILPSSRHLATDEIMADSEGLPIIDRQLFLLDCRLPEDVIKRNHPSLWSYLESGMEAGIHDRYLSRHRKPWYSQEQRPAALFLCTYMGRVNGQGHPFRFILNHSRATAANVYLLLYPKAELKLALIERPGLVRDVWKALGRISPESLIREGRVYGGGLHKLEPKELANANASPILEVFEFNSSERVRQMSLFA